MAFSDLPTWHPLSALFTVRLWQEMIGAEPGPVCMQVKHVLSGETRYFRDWTQLIDYLEGKLEAVRQSGQGKAGNMQ
ncbi:MAG: hypothetical protein R3E79_57445 [Caldilineaceae bacterium]